MKLRKNQEVKLSVMFKSADVLDCNAEDMMDFIKDDVVVLEASVTNIDKRVLFIGYEIL